MPKVTIYVPDDLKAEMDAVEDQEPNWSALAQAAFRAEVSRLSNRKRSAGKMNAVIERLRASKHASEDADLVAGHAAGREWAMNRAEYDELRRVAAVEEPPTGYEWAWVVACAALGDSRPDSSECRAFWESVSGDDTEVPEAYAQGVAEGAREVFEEVEDEL